MWASSAARPLTLSAPTHHQFDDRRAIFAPHGTEHTLNRLQLPFALRADACAARSLTRHPSVVVENAGECAAIVPIEPMAVSL
jgi:hypothetical protein